MHQSLTTVYHSPTASRISPYWSGLAWWPVCGSPKILFQVRVCEMRAVSQPAKIILRHDAKDGY